MFFFLILHSLWWNERKRLNLIIHLSRILYYTNNYETTNKLFNINLNIFLHFNSRHHLPTYTHCLRQLAIAEKKYILCRCKYVLKFYCSWDETENSSQDAVKNKISLYFKEIYLNCIKLFKSFEIIMNVEHCSRSQTVNWIVYKPIFFFCLAPYTFRSNFSSCQTGAFSEWECC